MLKPEEAGFLSPFSTPQPYTLANQLSAGFHRDNQLLLDFLTNRSQGGLVKNTFSDLCYTSASSRQGCVFLPLL